MLQKILSVLWILLLSAVLLGQEKAGMAFLKLPVEARSAAMGEAATALAGDASAIYWNPALLSENQSKSLVLMHNAYLADIAQEFVAFQFLQGRHNLGLSLNLMNIPGIEIRGDRPSEEPAGTTEAINLAASLAYAKKIKNNWALGLSVKYLYEKYYLQDASGWAIDLGLFKSDFLIKALDWGVTLQNAGKMQPLEVQATPLPLLLRSGLVYNWAGVLNHRLLQTTMDVVYLIRDQKMHVHGGLQATLLKSLVGRAGLSFDGNTWRYSLGFGLQYRAYQLNYAFSPYPYDLGNSHRFSLHWLF